MVILGSQQRFMGQDLKGNNQRKRERVHIYRDGKHPKRSSIIDQSSYSDLMQKAAGFVDGILVWIRSRLRRRRHRSNRFK